ncbi:MAG: HDOD domain-containing protein [Betaproteobacteria bacterium]
MAQSQLIGRTPITNRSQEIVGYEFRLPPQPSHSEPPTLVSSLIGTGGKDSLFERLANRIVLVDAEQVTDVKQGSVPANRMVAQLDAAQPADVLSGRMRKLKAAGFGVCLRRPYAGDVKPEALDLANYFTFDAGELKGELEKTCNKLRKYNAKHLAVAVDTPQSFESAHRAGSDLFRGYYFTVPAQQQHQSQAVSPNYATIVALMKLAKENAPAAKIEEALKRDAALSFKLLRYINSAGFGLSCEIQSFRHAVAVLGYQNLYRWLALLMVTAARQSASSALVTTAITRGHLAELIGANLFDAQERDNLFIVGAFSLLDAILQLPLDTIVEQIALPEPVLDALFRQEGAYGPILSLVEACESVDRSESADTALELAGLLGLNPSQLNRAQFDAMVWAENIGQQ